MSIVCRGAPVLLALLASGACSSETINLLSPAGDGGMGPTRDAATDGIAGDGGLADAHVASCPERVDQELGDCAAPPVTSCTTLTTSTTGGAMVQVFTPALDGAITRVVLWMQNADPARTQVVVAIADLLGNPGAVGQASYSIDDHLLATTQLPMTNQFAWQQVAFASPPAVVAHRPYAIYVRVASPFAINSSAGWGIYENADVIDPYRGGEPFVRGSDGTWLDDGLALDFMFEVHMIPSSCP
jgi:hypothetical protein